MYMVFKWQIKSIPHDHGTKKLWHKTTLHNTFWTVVVHYDYIYLGLLSEGELAIFI